MAPSETKLAAYNDAKNRLTKFFDDHKDATGNLVMTPEEGIEVKNRNTELTKLNQEYQDSRDIEEIERKHRELIINDNRTQKPIPFSVGKAPRGGDGASLIETKSLGDRFIEHKGYSERPGKNFTLSLPDFEVKTLFQITGGAGFDPFVPRIPRIQLTAQQQPKLVDTFPIDNTTAHSIKYMLENLFTNAAAPVAEAGAYPEVALQFVETLAAIQKIAAFLPVTDEQIDDVDQISALLNSRMDLMVRQAFDQQVATGNGTAPNLQGLLTLAGTNAFAKAGGDATPDAILEAINLVETVGFSTASAIWMNPTDWMNVRLLRTADGVYIWGHPSMTGPATIWGLPVVTSTYVTLGKLAVGDFAGQSQIWMRKGIDFEVANQHSDWFAAGKKAVRAQLRAAAVYYRPSAFSVVSGI